MPVLPRTTTARAVVIAAICGAWVASCSSDVDQFHLAEGLQGGGGDGATSGASGGGQAGATGNAGGSAASAGSNAGGSGGSNAGGKFGTQSHLDGGPDSGAGGKSDASVEGGAGAGGVVIGAGGTNAGGAGSGGTGSGGIGAGGAGSGGTGSGGTGSGGNGSGGKTGSGGAGSGGTGSGGAGSGGKTGSGGAGSGGAGSGGAGSGGAGSGGAGSGGAGSGGAGSGGTGSGGTGSGGAGSGGAGAGGAGGTWPANPVVKALDTTVTGVTAAAWEPTSKHFFLLSAAAHQFWELDPAAAPQGHITGPFSITATTLYTRPFGASASTIYVVADGAIRRLGHDGTQTSSVALSVTPAAQGDLTGAYAGGWFFVGYLNGATQALQDGLNALDPGAKGLTNVHAVSTDGQSFAFIVASATRAKTHRVAPGTFTLNATPCDIGSFATAADDPLGLHGTTIAWVSTASGQSYTLHVAPLPGGVCGAVSTLQFGASTTGSLAVGLLDDQYAVVTTNVLGSSVTMTIEDSVSGLPAGNPTGGTNAGTGAPIAFVMGTDAPTHYAVLVTRDRPILVSF